jgi:hypothetical protein
MVRSDTMETKAAELKSRIQEIFESSEYFPPCNPSETQYHQARDLVWEAINANPTDRELYRLLFEDVEIVHGFPSLERKKAVLYEIYEYAAEYCPAWADARSFLGVADADLGRCEPSRQRFLEGLKLGDTPSEVAACLYHYIWTTRLSILESGSHPRCGPGPIAPIADVVDQLREDWENIASNITDLESRITPDARVTYQRLRLKMHRLEAGATSLQSVLTQEQWNRLQIHHLSYLAWPFGVSAGYDPETNLKILGLDGDWQGASLLERLILDRSLQQCLKQLDVNPEPEEEAWVSDPLGENRDHVMIELWARGEFDMWYEMLSALLKQSTTELVRSREKLENSPCVSLRFETEVVHGLLEPDLTLIDFVVAVNHHMRSLREAIAACHDLSRLSYLIRLAVRDQPWLGRQLARRANICDIMRSWLESEGILRIYREDTSSSEIDDWLTQSNWEELERDYRSQPGISTPATRMYDAIQQFVNVVEDKVKHFEAKATERPPAHGLDRLMGAHIWRWLPGTAQNHLATGENEYLYRLELVRHGGLQPTEWSGIYLHYQKALETTLKTRLWRFAPKGERLYGLGSYCRPLDCLRGRLPTEAQTWIDELKQRIEKIKAVRNPAIHEGKMSRKDYEHLRHLLLGTRFEGRRTFSTFWLAYAISGLAEATAE